MNFINLTWKLSSESAKNVLEIKFENVLIKLNFGNLNGN